MIQFQSAQHKYSSIVPDNISWISVTNVCGSLKKKFNPEEQAPKSTVNRKSKWYGVPVQDILDIWKREGRRSVEEGKWYHNKVEAELLAQESIDGLKVHRSQMADNIKLAPPQILTDGVYPEHMVYLESAGICGQVDKVVVRNGVLDIYDHKTSKEIKMKGYTNWEGVTTKMLKPVQHLEECDYNSYSIQLSLYMYMICRWNSILRPGTMTINHVKLKEFGQDQYGYPIHETDSNGDYIVESVTPIRVEYMLPEVQKIIQYIKDPMNRRTIYK